MTTITEIQTTQVYQIFIKATPEAIWDAITKPSSREKYFHGVRVTTSRPSGTCRTGRTTRCGATRTCHRVRPAAEARARLAVARTTRSSRPRTRAASRGRSSSRRTASRCSTVVHDQLEGAPKTAAGVSGVGWMSVLSGLKTLLETGEPLTEREGLRGRSR